MKPLYLLLLLLMACGFFACTTDLTQETTEIIPASEGKTLDAVSLTEFTEFLVDFDVFVEGSLSEEADYGAGDFRLYFDAGGEFAFDPLTEDSYLPATEYEDPLAALPARSWTSTIELGFTPASADRLNKWLIQHFNHQQSIDLRIALLENGTILFQGTTTTAKAITDFPAQDWF